MIDHHFTARMWPTQSQDKWSNLNLSFNTNGTFKVKAVQANVDLRQAACLFGWKENIDGKIIFRVGSFIFQVRKIISSLAQHYTFSPKVEGK